VINERTNKLILPLTVIDVVHGAIASAATYGALLGATPNEIESAIGMVVAHYIPWRAIRAGKQL
jgi:2-methylcitrate dehydratase